MRKMAPLPASFMLISILGLIVTGIYTFSQPQRIPISWGIASLLVFTLMFIASVLSITPSKGSSKGAARKEPVKGMQMPLMKSAPKPARKARKRSAKKRRAARKSRKRRR